MRVKLSNIFFVLVITAVITSTFVSCGNKIAKADKLDLDNTPSQRVTNMFAVQSQNGNVGMRMEADIMEHYDGKDESYDYFPNGISVYAYTAEGLLESIIIADEAKHILPKYTSSDNPEVWSAFGNVVLHNVIKQETMETDTIYWDQTKQEIYTDCYVKLYSRDGFTQGYGMRSDDHVRNARLYKPFNSYAVTVQDTTAIVIDSVNFIGAFPKK